MNETEHNPAIFDKPNLLYDIMMGNQELFMNLNRTVKQGKVKYKQVYTFYFSKN